MIAKPKLLSGGNPQIAKADGDAPVQAYIAAMPGWKRAAGKRLDRLIEKTVPGVRKAVKWNSPLYGVADQGWFLSFHVFHPVHKDHLLPRRRARPAPAGRLEGPQHPQLPHRGRHRVGRKADADWIRQAAAIPGWMAR